MVNFYGKFSKQQKIGCEQGRRCARHRSLTAQPLLLTLCAPPTGALVLFDCIDRHACFNGHELSSQNEFREVDGFL